jgi:hypothetical protein
MAQLSRDSLWTLEHYSRIRNQFRQEVMAHKKVRQVALGDHITLFFEDEKTVRYQVQEMLRIEKTFEESGIQDELDAYDPVIRKVELAKLKGVEDRVWVQVEGRERVYAIADEDLERENEEKTSSVHFMRFELDEDMAGALKYGVSLAVGVDHPSYTAVVDPVAAETRVSLVKDLA